ncbi:MAG: universal stress protein [Gammaproteobacteria bacterium]|nr:universal stress protein [Gammaproteobacteria bacterium]
MNNSQVPFIKSILHPTDFSPASEKAFAHALAIALLRQTEFTILNVGNNKSDGSEWKQFPAVRKTLERWGLLEKDSPQSAVFDQLGVSVIKTTTVGTNKTSAILKYLDSNPIDLAVLATEGREGLPRWINRSKAEAIAQVSNTITLFVPEEGKSFIHLEDGDISLKCILVPIDRQPSPNAAIIYATRAAQTLGVDTIVEIILLHVGTDDTVLDLDLPENSAWKFKKEVRQGEPVEEIINAANQFSADAIFMATAGHEGILDAMRGSTTEQIVRKAPCPLAAIPQSWGKEL